LRRVGEAKGNVLYFSNKKAEDVILEDELRAILGEDAHFILSREKKDGYEHGHIDGEFLKRSVSDFKQPFYVCGPDQMIADVNDLLMGLGASAESLVFEK
jgi:ferredoxin-NADP reductase